MYTEHLRYTKKKKITQIIRDRGRASDTPVQKKKKSPHVLTLQLMIQAKVFPVRDPRYILWLPLTNNRPFKHHQSQGRIQGKGTGARPPLSRFALTMFRYTKNKLNLCKEFWENKSEKVDSSLEAFKSASMFPLLPTSNVLKGPER